MKIRGFLSLVLLGYMLGYASCQFDTQFASFIMYKLIPFSISLDNVYVGLQSLSVHFSTASTMSLVQTDAQVIYAELLPSLGYDFLNQFDDFELLLFYLHAIDNNIELSLEALLTSANQPSLGFSTFLALPLSNRGKEFFSSIKSTFLNLYLKMVKIILFFFVVCCLLFF